MNILTLYNNYDVVVRQDEIKAENRRLSLNLSIYLKKSYPSQMLLIYSIYCVCGLTSIVLCWLFPYVSASDKIKLFKNHLQGCAFIVNDIVIPLETLWASNIVLSVLALPSCQSTYAEAHWFNFGRINLTVLMIAKLDIGPGWLKISSRPVTHHVEGVSLWSVLCCCFLPAWRDVNLLSIPITVDKDVFKIWPSWLVRYWVWDYIY